MKKVGIVVDDWKLEAFKKMLKEKGFDSNIKTFPFTKGTTAITVEIHDRLVKDAQRSIQKLNLDLKQSN